MPCYCVYITGNQLSKELIEKIDEDGYQALRPSDFGLESDTRVR